MYWKCSKLTSAAHLFNKVCNNVLTISYYGVSDVHLSNFVPKSNRVLALIKSVYQDFRFNISKVTFIFDI